MGRRRTLALRTSSRCRPLVCAALTLYSTWPVAQDAPSIPIALRMSSTLARAVEIHTHSGEPITLILAVELAERSTPAHGAAPLSLQLATAFVTVPSRADPEKALARALQLDAPEPVLYAVRLNGQAVGVARLLRLSDGRWAARRGDLEQWRLQIPPVAPVTFREEEHFPLDAFEGMTYELRGARQELDLQIAPRYFASTVVEATALSSPQPVPPPPGGFANYDVFLQAGSGMRRVDALLEAGFFNRLGVGVSGFVAHDLGGEGSVVRLETAWRRDFASEMKTLVIGDAIGSSGIWGRPVRFGGVSYGTNFATRPGFITFALPGLSGEAALPTTAELYVDGVLRQSTRVPPGPFRVENVPVVTGRGEVRLVVRDLLGREQAITLPYYASPLLLREGLTEESNELGAVRNNFGLRSHDYGRVVAAIQRRRGFSDALTGEVRAELLRDQQTAGAGASARVGDLGVFTAAAAASLASRGAGGLLFAGVERQSSKGVSYGLRSQWTSEHFTQLGVQPEQRAPLRTISGSLGYSAGILGSFGVTYLRQDQRERPSTDLASASYTVNLSRAAAIIVFAFKPLNGFGSSGGGLTLSMGLGERTSAAGTYSTQGGAREGLLQVQRNLPAGTGTGYRLLAGGGSRGPRQEAGVAYQNDTGIYTLEAGHADDRTAVRASASGGLAFVEGRAFLARTLSESFGVAHVPGFRNVGIYLHNQMVARTDADGYAIVPGLLPYQANAVRIDPADLPLDTRIDSTRVEAVPYFRSGMTLRFPVERANSALVVLVLDGGEPMPAGSIVTVSGRAEEFPVAERGEVYVTGLAERNRLRATWRDQSCEFDVVLAGKLGSQPKVGPIACPGVRR